MFYMEDVENRGISAPLWYIYSAKIQNETKFIQKKTFSLLDKVK